MAQVHRTGRIMHDFNDCVIVPSAINWKLLVFAGLVLLASVLSSEVNASPDTYSGSAEYSSTSGHRGWTYWDSLGEQMVWDEASSRWTCLNPLTLSPLTPRCYWTSTGGHPGIDRNVFRRWTPPGAGSARITGWRQKDSSFCDEQNVAVGKTSTQSSVGWGGVPSRGNDGKTDGDFAAGSVMHTDSEGQAWYQIDLGASYRIHRIEVWNRSDGSSGESARTTNFNVMTSEDGLIWTTVNVPGQAAFPTSLAWLSYGRYVKVQLVGTDYLNLAEVQVFSNANDGVFANIWQESAQSNSYLTYTTPGPTQRKAYSWYMGCSDLNVYSYDIDAEIYPGDKIEFEINRISNYNSDGTTFDPTIVFEPADAIGDPWASTTPTSVEVRFNGLLKCPNGAHCGYTDTLPPDYYTVHRMGTISSGSVFLGHLPNWVLCGPADGRFCVDTVRPSNFSVVDNSGISPNSSYKYKIQAYRGTYPNGRLYGQTRTVQITTGAITPPSLTPTVSVTAASFEYSSRDAVISWQAPAPPLDKHYALDRFELYRQGLSSVTTNRPFVPPQFSSGEYGTGEQLCAGLSQSSFPGQWTCLPSTAPGGSCSATLNGFGILTCALWDPPVRVGYTKWDNNNINQIWVNTADQGSPSRETYGDFGHLITSVTDPGVDRKPTTYRYYLVARYKSAYASPTETSEVTANVVLPRADTIAGFADAHVHQFGNLGHGGRVLDGRSGDTNDGSPTYNASLRDMGSFLCNATGKALRGCDAAAAGGTGAHDFGFWGNALVDLVGLGHNKDGIKNLPEWLSYSNSLHQQVYKTALKRAVDGGLRLMVMQAVNSEFLCKAVALLGGGQSPISCDDSEVLDMQITAAYRFQSEIDREANCFVPDEGLPNTNLDNSCGWYRIVTTPAAARKVMKNGKLAVVLGIEAATPFACGTGSSGGMFAGGDASNWNQGGTRPTCAVGGSTGAVVNLLDPLNKMSLQFFYNRGIRHVFPVHGANNGLGSAAFFNPSNLYAYNQAALNGTWFRPGPCLNRGENEVGPDGPDGPMAYRISPALKLSLGPFGDIDFGGILFGSGMTVPSGFPGGSGATCNLGGNFADGLALPAAPFGLTSLGRSVIQEMMKRRMLIDVDHMSELTHIDAVAESRKSFNYPLVSGHSNLQRIAKLPPDYVVSQTGGDPGSEVSLSTPELNEVRASGGQVNLVAVASFETKDIADYYPRMGGNAAAAQFQPRANTQDPDSRVLHNCDNSSKAWAQAYLAAVDLTRNAPMPTDNSAPGVYGVGFGSDFNTMMSMIQPRFGFKSGGEWYGCGGFKATSGDAQQLAQLAENAVGGKGKAVQYDVDMIDGSPTLKGHGGIATSLQAKPELNFPGFSGPRLRRSRLNEGGYLFTLFGRDKAITSTGQFSETPECLDSWGWTSYGDWPRIDHCGDTRKGEQQWLYENQRISPYLDQTKNLVSQRRANNDVLINSSCTSNCESAVTYASASSGEAGVWVTLPSGQLYNPQSDRCLGVQNHGYGAGNRVVAAPCAGNSFGTPLQADQMWARGGEEESFNLTGLHHIGMYPDFIQDLKNIGLTDKDLVPLFQSAEGYLQMWERTGWTKAIDYTKLSSDGTWKFTTASPAAGWTNINFNDTTWRSVSDTYSSLAAYGNAPWYSNVSGVTHPTPALWMPIADGNHTYYFRKTFVSDKIGTLKTVTVSGLTEEESCCNNVVKVYFDGVLKASSNNWQIPAKFTFTPDKFGSHVIAIEATSQGGPGGVLVDVR